MGVFIRSGRLMIVLCHRRVRGWPAVWSKAYLTLAPLPRRAIVVHLAMLWDHRDERTQSLQAPKPTSQPGQCAGDARGRNIGRKSSSQVLCVIGTDNGRSMLPCALPRGHGLLLLPRGLGLEYCTTTNIRVRSE